MKKFRNCIKAIIPCSLLLMGIQQALAHSSPPGCGGAGVGVQVFKFRLDGVTVANTITNGERVIYQIQVQNNAVLGGPGGTPVCDVTCASVFFQCPDSSGNPGARITVATGINLPFPTPPFTIGSVTCAVSVASSITSARAHVDVIGVVHDLTIPGCTPDATCVTNSCDPDIGGGQQEVSVTVRTPCIDVTKQCVSAVNVGGNAVVVSFTGSVSNCGNETLVNVGITNNQPVAGTLVTNISSLAVGQVINFSGTYTNTSNICGPFPDTITATGQGVGSLGIVTDSASAQCTITYTPCLSVTKTCPTVVVGASQTISGVVSNCGNITITNISVNDNILGAVTNISRLDPGQAVSYSKSFTAGCIGNTNTVTASGNSVCGQPATASATAPCLVTENPCIHVTKNCSLATVPVGGTETFSGSVSNCGNIGLTNVVLHDTFLNKDIATIPTLAVGQSVPYSTNYIATAADCSRGTLTNTMIATGRDACGTQNVRDEASCTFIVTCPPCIAITKEVACFLGTNAQGVDVCGTYGKFAIGVQGTHADGTIQEPAFCYRITITNCSSIPLTNVTVSDNRFPEVGASDFPCIVAGNLAAGASCSFEFKVELGTTDTTATFVTNTVSTTGASSFTGAIVSDSDDAAVEVIPAKLSCNKFYTIDGGPFTNDVTLLDQNPHVVVYYVTITNTGLANLLDLTVTDVGTDPTCNGSFSLRELDAAASITIPLCTNAAFTCTNKGISDTITIVANAFSFGTNTGLCAHDIRGSNIVASTECSAAIFCSSPAACRVTGGGRQDAPLVCPDDVRYVTHGGQVGAPVGNKVCSIDTNLPNFFLGNPCIHGRWTHVRHVQGGLEGNFHARFFDTLDCACLDTNLNPETCQYGPETVVNGVCGDRSTGPLPRPAPANKIAFTGVGDWACPNGHRESRACLFRVDIEDRGEPGNAHALASNKKENRIPDRYRIRIWVLSDAELAALNGSSATGDKWLLNFRNCISACNGIDFQDGGVGCNIANTCTSGDSCSSGAVAAGTITFPGGCPVRLPNIDDGGELLHGNHQIHPAIKDCDPFDPTGPGLAKP